MNEFIEQLPGNSIHNPARPTHFMWLQPVQRRIALYQENIMIAVTTRALRVIEVGNDVLEPTLYLPRADVLANLKQNDKTSHCPLKGDTVYFDLLDDKGGVAIANIAWSYTHPIEIASELKDRVAFDRTYVSTEDAPL